MTAGVSVVLSAMSAMAALAVTVFFLRFLRQTGDGLFGWLALAFALMALHWIVLTQVGPDDHRHLIYLVRLAAFLVILVGIVRKNRRP